MIRRDVLLIGEPGSGKTTMATLTLPESYYPLHIVDLDRKVRSIREAQSLIESGRLSVKEITEDYMEESLASVITLLSQRRDTGTPQKPSKKPKGWEQYATYLQNDMLATKEFKECNTLLIDSYTQVAAHCQRLVAFSAGSYVFEIKEWGAFKGGMEQGIQGLTNICKDHGKSLIVTVHEREVTESNENTTVILGKDSLNKLIGSADLKIAASIPGQFGRLMSSYFTDVYGLNVIIPRSGQGVINYACRIKPDWKRTFLRCSFASKGDVFRNDFRAIWGEN